MHPTKINLVYSKWSPSKLKRAVHTGCQIAALIYCNANCLNAGQWQLLDLWQNTGFAKQMSQKQGEEALTDSPYIHPLSCSSSWGVCSARISHPLTGLGFRFFAMWCGKNNFLLSCVCNSYILFCQEINAKGVNFMSERLFFPVLNHLIPTTCLQ